MEIATLVVLILILIQVSRLGMQGLRNQVTIAKLLVAIRDKPQKGGPDDVARVGGRRIR